MTATEVEALLEQYNNDYKNQWNQSILIANCLGAKLKFNDIYSDGKVEESTEDIEAVKQHMLELLNTIDDKEKVEFKPFR